MTPIIQALIQVLVTVLPGIEQAILGLIKSHAGETPTPGEAQALHAASQNAQSMVKQAPQS